MDFNELISNVHVYGLEEAVIGSKYPMSVDVSTVTNEITPTVIKLAQSSSGHGHDTFLNGILVTFDLTCTNKMWVEMERYKFVNFISSQSTMHRIAKFDLDKAYNEYVDPQIVKIMKRMVKHYNEMEDKTTDQAKEYYLRILYSNPAGFRLTAKLTTNYRALKTIYQQRKDHRLPEWRAFCKWVETLPYSELITGNKIESEE